MMRKGWSRLALTVVVGLVASLASRSAGADLKQYPSSFCQPSFILDIDENGNQLPNFTRTDVYMTGNNHATNTQSYVACTVIKDNAGGTGGTVAAAVSVVSPVNPNPVNGPLACTLYALTQDGFVVESHQGEAMTFSAPEVLDVDVNASSAWGYYSILCYVTDGDPRVVSYRVDE